MKKTTPDQLLTKALADLAKLAKHWRTMGRQERLYAVELQLVLREIDELRMAVAEHREATRMYSV